MLEKCKLFIFVKLKNCFPCGLSRAFLTDVNKMVNQNKEIIIMIVANFIH